MTNDKDFEFGEIIITNDRTIRLLKKAKIDEKATSVTKIEHGHVSTVETLIFTNCLIADKEIRKMFLQNLEEAIIVFRYQMVCAINPIKWIEYILFLPKILLNHVNIQNDKTITLSQSAYWLVSVAIIILQFLGVFR